MCSGQAGAVPARNRVPGTEGGSMFRYVSMGFDRFWVPNVSRFRWVLRFRRWFQVSKVLEFRVLMIFDGF